MRDPDALVVWAVVFSNEERARERAAELGDVQEWTVGA